LSDLRADELGLRPLETEPRKSETESLVRGAENLGRGGLDRREVFPHSGVLGALTGKQRRERPHQRTALAAQVSPAPNAAIRMMSPRRTFPARTASSRAIGIEAAEVFP
jgi:hypothetical protein